jgi:hypothetical protein
VGTLVLFLGNLQSSEGIEFAPMPLVARVLRRVIMDFPEDPER